MNKTRHFIVIGNPISHSKSPDLHAAFAQQVGIDICYNRQFCPNDFESFKAVVEAFFGGGGVGANVTVPFKEMAWQLCQGHISQYAQAAKAVNTLFIKDNKLYGDNTDGRGLVNDLQQKGVALKGKTLVILGAGGAARGAVLPLLQADVAHLHIANRTIQKACELACLFNNIKTNTQQITYSDLASLPRDIDVIINATSIGLSNERLSFDCTINAKVAYDMMYGRPSAFLAFFDKQNSQCFDGLGMLIHQGKLSFEMWTQKAVDLRGLGFDGCFAPQ